MDNTKIKSGPKNGPSAKVVGAETKKWTCRKHQNWTISENDWFTNLSGRSKTLKQDGLKKWMSSK